MTGALVAGFLAAPAASAAGGVPGGAAEAKGVAVAAAKAAKKGIKWQDCPAAWGLEKPIQCGYVTVPLNYAKPNGPSIQIAVDRVRATGTAHEHQGSLVYNPGGPGGSGLRFPRKVTTKNPIYAKIAKAYDFVGFDPRGVGKSAPISCVDPKEFVATKTLDPVPGSNADKLAQRKLAKQYADGCAQRSGKMLPYMTTMNTARDVDVVRAALGENKLNYLGVSYGTYLGAVYGTLFPSHVRRLIVDSVVNPAQSNIWYQANLEQDIAFEGRFKDWETWVAQHDSFFHIGNTQPKVHQEWLKLRAAAKKKPIGGLVGPAELINFFQSAAYYDSSWIPVATTWQKFRAGDTKALVDAAGPDLAGAATAENSNAVYTAVECADAKWPTSWQKWDRDNTRLNKQYPFMTWSNAWMNLPCATWKGPQYNPLEVKTYKGLPQTLIIQSTRDAATPYAGAVELHKRFQGSRLITEKGAGSHGVTGLVNPCINDRVDSYLLTGKVDAKDVVCKPHATPEPKVAG
ncbi:alpha/beta hydrolase [Streptomyces orinoci]|uniref:Alpha/beta hydrolase n=1 Tax=Streptomyces orinoci TaxID=67339 RepID=A0ABV3JRA5_STRON|nr:alpha/beta hydrolase [Streptomyces orinoci]